MNPDTGEIRRVKNAAEARAEGLVPIPRSKIRDVRALDTAGRIAWASQQRATVDARRAANKRARQSRRKNRG